MATDKTVLEGIFAGDNRAFNRFDSDNRDLFRAYFNKHFPGSEVEISEIYQEAITELWTQIREGRLTKEKLTVDISTYLLSVGKIKLFEETRKQEKFSRLKKDKRVFKKRERKAADPEEGENEKDFPLQSKKEQKDIDINIIQKAYELFRKKDEPGEEDIEETWEVKITRHRFVEDQVWHMEEPCKTVIRDTWWNEMSDKELMEKNPSLYPSINAIKTRRFRCHQKLRTLIRDNDLIQDWCEKHLNNFEKHLNN